MGGYADVTVCGRSISGATMYPEQGDAEWTAKLVGCGECARTLMMEVAVNNETRGIVESLSPPDRISAKRAAVLPVDAYMIRGIRACAEAAERTMRRRRVRWGDAFAEVSADADMQDIEDARRAADRLEAWLREQGQEEA